MDAKKKERILSLSCFIIYNKASEDIEAIPFTTIVIIALAINQHVKLPSIGENGQYEKDKLLITHTKDQPNLQLTEQSSMAHDRSPLLQIKNAAQEGNEDDSVRNRYSNRRRPGFHVINDKIQKSQSH